MASIYTLTALSVQRWLLVTRAGRVPVNSPAATAAAATAVLLLASAIALPPLPGWWAYYAPETSGIT